MWQLEVDHIWASQRWTLITELNTLTIFYSLHIIATEAKEWPFHFTQLMPKFPYCALCKSSLQIKYQYSHTPLGISFWPPGFRKSDIHLPSGDSFP